MTSKTISVTEEVYDMLAEEKLPGESFSKTIVRIIKNKGKITDCAGLWEKVDEKEIDDLKNGILKLRKLSKPREVWS